MKQPRGIAFDACGALFDVHSAGAEAERLFPERGAALAAVFVREKQR